MNLRNLTPFKTLLFTTRDIDGGMFRVFLARGTFELSAAARLRPARQQELPAFADQYHGEAGASSPYLTSDLLPMKPRTDIHVHAAAHAPSGLPARSWLVRVQVGALEKTLRVTGPRAWEKDDTGKWQLSEPEPCMQVPLRYELAFGGVFIEEWTASFRCSHNPVGRGYLPEGREPDASPWPAPQIESPDDPIGELGKPHRPEGLGPLGVAWEPRISRAGTRDEAWRIERCPRLPLDFDFGYYNSAHPDLIYPGLLRGDEEVLLEGLHPDGDLRFGLPAQQVLLLLHLGPGAMLPLAARLDTLVIDVPASRVYLTWRAVFQKDLDPRLLEVRSTEAPRPGELAHARA